MPQNPLDSSFNLIRAGDLDGAMHELASVLNKNPSNAAAWALMATLLDDPKKQADCYRQILRIDPGNQQALVRLTELAGRPEGGTPVSESPLDEKSAEQPDDSQETAYQCPNCGAQIEVPSVEKGPDRRALCSYCRAYVELPGPSPIEEEMDRPKKKLWGEQIAEAESVEARSDGVIEDPFRILPTELQQLTQLLREKGPDVLDDKSLQRLEERGITITMTEDGLVISSQFRKITINRSELPSRLGYLSSDQLVEMAGKPLAPTERYNCPKCDAVISVDETRCPWCSELLSPDQGDSIVDEPSAPTQRRKCPNCDALILGDETKCPWCSIPLKSG